MKNKFIKKLIRSTYWRFISENKFAEIIGVKYGKNPTFRTKNFGSEPYLIEVGDNFETSGNVNFITHDGSIGVLRNLYSELENSDFFAKIIIGNNVFIGINVTVLPATKIGNNVIIGAGSIVKGELKSNSVYAGVPAKFICTIEDYKNKIKDQLLPTFLMESKEKEEKIKAHFNVI